MKKGLILLILLISIGGCKKELIKDPEPAGGDPLTRFFIQCREDLKRAATVIVTRDIVKNLSHLQFMNAGGKRYYLLERENISQMIRAVTRGVYSDYILVNKKGTIIYTRDNNKIFSKNVRSHLKSTPLKAAYDRRDLPLFLSRVTLLNPADETYRVFISQKVSGGESFPGILILQIDARIILQYLEKGSELVGSRGHYHLSHRGERILQPCPYFSEIKEAVTDKSKTITLQSGKRVTARTFRFANRSWILVREEE